MQFTHLFNSPGEHSLTLQGRVGSLEAILTIPESIRSKMVAFIGHPHSLQGGTMNNKVVTTMARVFKELGIPSLRFNFRGVGASEGEYDAGMGESEDMIALVKAWQREQADVELVFAGFSFGSYVAYRSAAHFQKGTLITIAPPVHHYDYQAFVPAPSPWLILQGDADEVVPSEQVYAFAQNSVAPITVIRFPETGHFFHGKLLDLKAKALEYLKSTLDAL